MLAILLCWLCISVTFLSFGDFFILVYNKICNKNEKYSIIDTLFLGMAFIVIPLSISSFWLPANHYILLYFFIFSILYWAIRYKHFICCIKRIRKQINSLFIYQSVVIVLAMLSIAFFAIWLGGQWMHHDTFYYHQAAIRWNEEYAIVPGLGNVEERFGFNSNYLLISAIYTLRFIFDEPIYGLQSFMCAAVMTWILIETFKSGFEIRRIIILLLYLAFILIDRNTLGVTSTDKIPNLIIIYMGIKTVLYPHLVKRKLLFYATVPVALITFKLSGALIALSTIIIFFVLLKHKNYRIASFIFSIAFIIMGLWLIRNIIISGYLIHPLYQIDLFSFDWKIPADILINEVKFISFHARDYYVDQSIKGFLSFKIWNGDSWHIPLFILSLASLIFFAYKTMKKKEKVNLIYIYMYIILIIGMIYWLITAPAMRFGYGYVFSSLFLVLTIFPKKKCENIKFNSLFFTIETRAGKRYKSFNLCKYSSLLLFGYVFILSYKHTSDYRHFLRDYCDYNKLESTVKVFYTPYSTNEQISETKKIMNIPEAPFESYKLNNNIVIYIATEKRGFKYDIVPSASKETGVSQDYKNIEARGNSVQDGFRSRLNREK